MVLGFDIKLIDPAVTSKSDQAKKHHKTKRQPVKSQR